MSDAPSEPGDPVAGPARPERRRTRRIPLEAIVHYQIEGSQFIHISSNLSADGIFIKNFSPPAIGTELAIQVRLPEDLGGHQVELLGRVVRIEDRGQEHSRGMGVAFTSMRACAPEALRFFVNEVYEVGALERIEQLGLPERGPDCQQPAFEYTPTQERVLRLQAEEQPARALLLDDQPRLFVDPRKRMLWTSVLVLTGALLGAGLALVFLLGD